MFTRNLDRLFLSGLTLSLAATLTLPAFAKQTSRPSGPAPVSCQMTTSIGQGASLTYRFEGVFPDRTTSSTPQNPIGRVITMTVQKRDRNGKIQTILNRSIAQNFEEVGPDADYSKLPFTGEFRGKPNDGFRLYSVNGSTHGLYVSLRPTKGQPQKIQVVHYLSQGKFVRSEIGKCVSALV
jgi:hypothetical protein